MGGAVGVLLGEASIGWLVAIALTPLLSDTEQPEIGAAATVAAVWIAVDASATRGMGGLLVESWLGALAGLAGALLALLALRWTGRSGAGGIALGVIACLVGAALCGFVVRWPPALWGLAPWLAGALFVLGVGRLAGSARPRAWVSLLALWGIDLAAAIPVPDSAGALLMLGTLAGPALLLLGLRQAPRLSLPGAQWWQASLGLLVALQLAWIPYQLPAWDTPRLQLPGREVLLDLPTWMVVLPLFVLGLALGRALGPRLPLKE